MSLPGPFPVTPIQQTSLQDIQIRPLQRITAAVVQVTGVQAILAIDGYPVVAKLASQNQAAALKSQKYAQFIVSQVNDKEIILRFVQPDAQTGEANIKTGGGDIAVRLMGEMGLEATSDQLVVTRALLGQNLAIAPDLLDEIVTVLNQGGEWGEAEAQLAAALKAAGLPLTPASLSTVSGHTLRIADILPEVIEQLNILIEKQSENSPLRGMLDQVLSMLKNTIPDISRPTIEITDQLQTVTQLMGRSVESILSAQVKNPEALWPDNSIILLSRLSNELKREGFTDAAESIDHLIEQTRLNQFLNVKPDPSPGKGAWSELDFIIQVPPQGYEARQMPAKFKISYRGEAQTKKIDPNYTRVVVQVDLETGKPIQIDLSILNQQIRADITTTDPLLAQKSREQLPELIEHLVHLGYDVKSAMVEVGPVTPAGESHVITKKITHATTIDLEV